MQHQLHATRVVEETLEHQVFVGGQDAQRGQRGAQVANHGVGHRVVDLGFTLHPARGRGDAALAELVRDCGAQHRDLFGQLGRARRCFAEPEWNRR